RLQTRSRERPPGIIEWLRREFRRNDLLKSHKLLLCASTRYMRMRIFAWLLLSVSGFAGGNLLSSRAATAAVGSAFTYQGRLLENGAPANGPYDLQFAIFGTETGGS